LKGRKKKVLSWVAGVLGAREKNNWARQLKKENKESGNKGGGEGTSQVTNKSANEVQ